MKTMPGCWLTRTVSWNGCNLHACCDAAGETPETGKRQTYWGKLTMIDQAVLYLLWIRCLQDSKEFQRLVRKLYPDIDVDDADSIVAEYLKKQAEWQAELNRACDVIEDFMEREPGGVSSQNQEQVEEIMENTTTVKTEAK